MKKKVFLMFIVFNAHMSFSQIILDDNENVFLAWTGDDCNVEVGHQNPYMNAVNLSQGVVRYHDTGGQYANIRLDASSQIKLYQSHTFSFKIYVPSSGLTGNQSNQVSLKLQNNTINEPWSTQTEIIKPVILDQWQAVTFDFLNDNYVNLDQTSPQPIYRNDLNRILIQVNGENNNDQVLATHLGQRAEK